MIDQLKRDLQLRASQILWFDEPLSDAVGASIKIPESVTPTEDVVQWFDAAEDPIRISAGRKCVVVGVSSEAADHVWLEIDSAGPFANANVVLPANKVRII